MKNFHTLNNVIFGNHFSSNIVGLGIIWSWLTYNAFIGLLWFITSRRRQITDVCYKSLFSYFLGGNFTRVFIDFSTALVIGGCDVMLLRFYFVKCESYIITFSSSDTPKRTKIRLEMTLTLFWNCALPVWSDSAEYRSALCNDKQ